MDFNASIILYRGIILVSKLYPSRCGHLMRSANGNPTELTKISTLFFNFSSRRPRTHGCRLDKFDTCLSEKPKLLKHHSFQPMFSFPTPNIAHIAYANPFLSPESSAYWHDSVIFSSKFFPLKLLWANRTALPLTPITPQIEYPIFAKVKLRI